MPMIRRLLQSAALCAAVSLCGGARAQTPDAHLNAVLAQMDAASQKFQNARAEFQWDYYEALVKDTTTQTGSIYFERKGAALSMGAVVYGPTHKKAQVLEYKGGTLLLYDLGLDQIRPLRAGQNQGQYEAFLTLGFGGSGKDLARAWNITDLGQDKIADGGATVTVEKLDLVSKDPNLRNNFTHITLWVDPTRGVSLKQVFETPGHDRRTATYSHVRLNGSIDRGTFEIKKGPKTTVLQ